VGFAGLHPLCSTTAPHSGRLSLSAMRTDRVSFAGCLNIAGQVFLRVSGTHTVTPASIWTPRGHAGRSEVLRLARLGLRPGAVLTTE
jgi:hypothetical protein